MEEVSSHDLSSSLHRKLTDLHPPQNRRLCRLGWSSQDQPSNAQGVGTLWRLSRRNRQGHGRRQGCDRTHVRVSLQTEEGKRRLLTSPRLADTPLKSWSTPRAPFPLEFVQSRSCFASKNKVSHPLLAKTIGVDPSSRSTDKKKLNSHRWAFNAFCPQLRPNVCVLLDVGTR